MNHWLWFHYCVFRSFPVSQLNEFNVKIMHLGGLLPKFLLALAHNISTLAIIPGNNC